jgi:hypothetical protein
MKRRSSSTLNRQAAQPLSPTPSLPRNRNVTFNLSLQIREIERMFDPDQMDAIWWSDDDYEDFAVDNRKMIERMQHPKVYRALLEMDNHSSSYDLQDTVRGLEYHIPAAAERRMSLRYDCATAVLYEQEAQRHEGITDDVRIAKAYIRLVTKCRETALVIGLRDARLVQQQYAQEQQQQQIEQRRQQQQQQQQLQDQQSLRSERSYGGSSRSSFSRRGSLEMRRSSTTSTTTAAAGTDLRSQRERFLRAKLKPKNRPVTRRSSIV